MLKRAIVLALVVSVLVSLLIYSQHRPPLNKVSGFIEAHEIRVGSRVGGRVLFVPALEGKTVRAGELLVQFEPYDLEKRQAEAEQQLYAKQADYERLRAGNRPEEILQAQARRDQLAAELDELKAGPRKQEIEQAEALLEQAQAARDLADSTHTRIKALFTANRASPEEMDKAANDLKSAAAAVKAHAAELDQLKEGTRQEEIAIAAAQLAEADAALTLMKKGYRPEEVASAKATAAAAEAALQAINRQIEELQVKAPTDGTIEAVEIRPGDLLAPNAPALSLLDNSELWVRAYVPENRLDLATGQTVRVTVDSFPGRDFTGRISFISRDAEFTPGNVQTPEERSKQVFRIKVTLDKEEPNRDLLRAGMNADVWLK